eukprot:4630282-Amphidinium_carterae.2
MSFRSERWYGTSNSVPRGREMGHAETRDERLTCIGSAAQAFLVRKDLEDVRRVRGQTARARPCKDALQGVMMSWQKRAKSRGSQKVFGRAMAECQKERIFQDYAELELKLGNID